MNYWPFLLFIIASAYFIIFKQAPWQAIAIAAPLFLLVILINQNRLGGFSQKIIELRKISNNVNLQIPDWWPFVLWGIAAIVIILLFLINDGVRHLAIMFYIACSFIAIALLQYLLGQFFKK